MILLLLLEREKEKKIENGKFTISMFFRGLEKVMREYIQYSQKTSL